MICSASKDGKNVRWMPKGDCDPVHSPRWSKLLSGPVAPWWVKPMLEQVYWQDLWPRGGPTLEQSVPEGPYPMEVTHTGAVHEELQPMQRTLVGEVHGGLSPCGRDPTVEQGRVWGVLLWGGRRSRDSLWWADHNSHSLSPCTTEGEEVEKSGVKLSLRRRDGWGDGICKICFYFLYSDLIVNKSN